MSFHVPHGNNARFPSALPCSWHVRSYIRMQHANEASGTQIVETDGAITFERGGVE